MRILLFLVVLFVVPVSGGFSAQAAASLFDDPVIARGKGVEVRQARLEEAFIHHKANLASRGKTLPEGQRALREAQLLDRLIITQLLVNRANDADKAKAKELAEKFTEETRKLASNEDSFYRQLKAMGLSATAYKNILHEQALAEAVMERELKSTIAVTDAQVQEFYNTGTDNLVKIMQGELERLVKDTRSTPAQLSAVKEQIDRLRNANLERLNTEETVKVAHIFMPTRNRETGEAESDAEVKGRRQRLEGALKRAKAGQDFSKLIKEFSQDPNLAETKGEYVVARSDRFTPEFKGAAFSLTKGQISEIVSTPLGFHIIKLLERTPEQKMEFAKVAKDIKEHLMQQAYQQAMPAYFARLKKEAAIEVLDGRYKLSTAEESASLKPPG
ncbi:MAG TPA: peptidylprolyl isomerase [Verrucomicrobiae bacterium]|nr:peptidylprolyl isomerase [Verrucomicrobiae bacterium]